MPRGFRNRRSARPRKQRLTVKRLEARQMLAADLVISEFLAINDGVAFDEDGDTSDWIEIHNPTSQKVALSGWSLTDEATDLDKWGFPADTIAAGVIPELATPSAMSISLWFKRDAETSSATNHNVNNILVAHSASATNDNFEIGTQGGNIEIYLDTTAKDGPNPSITQSAGIQNSVWYHLAITYDRTRGNEVQLSLDVGQRRNGRLRNRSEHRPQYQRGR